MDDIIIIALTLIDQCGPVIEQSHLSDCPS